jgi:hypothetical protein
MSLQYLEEENESIIWSADYFPKKLNPYEKILLTLRQDTTILIEQALLGFGLFILVLILKIYFFGNISDDATSYLIEGLTYGFASIEIVIFAYFFHNYFLSQIVITNMRVIEVQQKGLLFVKINQHLIENFKSIKIDRERARYVLGDKGHITIEMKEKTNLPPLQLEHVPKPDEVASSINQFIR